MICSGLISGRPGTFTSPNPRCRRVEDREVPVPRRELLEMPVRPESDPVNEEPAVPEEAVPVVTREIAADAVAAATEEPTGASPQRSQKPWSIVPPHPEYWHFSAVINVAARIGRRNSRSNSTRRSNVQLPMSNFEVKNEGGHIFAFRRSKLDVGRSHLPLPSVGCNDRVEEYVKDRRRFRFLRCSQCQSSLS